MITIIMLHDNYLQAISNNTVVNLQHNKGITVNMSKKNPC